MSVSFPETTATSAAEFTLRGYLERVDNPPVRVVIIPQPIVETVEQARTRIRRFDIAAWTTLVERFAERVRELDAEAEIWATSESEPLVTAVTPRDDLDHELALHAVFVDLARALHDPAIGSFVVRTPESVEAMVERDLGQRVA